MKINLPSTIEENIQHFTGRTWLLPHLIEWFEESDERLFILTGDPGTGKSMIMAWLAGVGPAPAGAKTYTQLEQVRSWVKAVYFCVAESGSTAPKAMAQNMAEQLTQNVIGFGDALAATLSSNQVRISTTQRIGIVGAGGSVTGVHIEHLDLRGLSEELSFNQVLREPLQKLYANGYQEPVLLLVDALDEALTYTGKTNIVQLLVKLGDLPPEVRVLLTTRPDPRVLKQFRGIEPFNLVEDAPKDVDDVRDYSYERLNALEDKLR
ncbi:MAG: nSTAND1 domain-containing NTPase, partial [bacterium]